METQVVIVGAGATGTSLARDLALRGVKCLLLEKSDINAGASGANHGLLHSGGRYVYSDAEAAAECRDEGALLKKLAPQCIEDTGGLFVAAPGDDESYIADFPKLCQAAGVPCAELSPAEALEREPNLSKDIIAAYALEDAAIDPFMLSLDNLAQALDLGCEVRRNVSLVEFKRDKHRISAVCYRDEMTGKLFEVGAEVVVNASGAWAGKVASLVGAEINILYSMGSLLVTQDRLSRRVINRLRKPSDSDILVPGGTVSILGTTSVRINSPDECRPTVGEVDAIIDDAKAMMPILDTTRYIRAYAGVRPLVSSVSEKGSGLDDRKVTRGFSLIDHTRDDVDNFVTITGGKLTTHRLMAEKTADLICEKLGVTEPCRTRTEPLPASEMGMWTEPGRAPKTWVEKRSSEDLILCECELVSRDVVDAISEKAESMRGSSLLQAVGARSRVGKGPCQGGFCGPRVTAHLYDRGKVSGEQGITELKHFIERRWRGLQPILWNLPLMQAELQEAVHCGVMELELAETGDSGTPGSDSTIKTKTGSGITS